MENANYAGPGVAAEADEHASGGLIDTDHSPHCALRSVDLGSVRWGRGFWSRRLDQLREVTLPLLHDLMANPDHGHALTNLRIAAGLEEGEFAGTHWQDEWVYKWLEAAALVYQKTLEPDLDRRMDEVIAVIARAQQPDGYLATQTVVRGWPRYRDVRHHELYVMGHLMTAACVHHRCTGKDNFLSIARRVGNHLHAQFLTDEPTYAHNGVNPSYVMGLIELYRTTGDRRYLDTANAFLDARGRLPRGHDDTRDPGPGGTDHNQDRVPLREEEQVVGHMVMATYLYSGAADAYMEGGDESLLAALERLWRDLTLRKTYVQGGVAPTHRGLSIRDDVVWEAADRPYVLPNSTAYNETCAQIGAFMFNYRMLSITGRAVHAEAMEQALYNGILSGIGLNGREWFYTNVLRWYGPDHPLLRKDHPTRFVPGRDDVCCPSNLLRTLAGLHGYAYSASDTGLWVNLYGANSFEGTLPGGARLKLRQDTTYPWDGLVKFTVEEVSADPSPRFTLHLRVPTWAGGATAKVNGEPIEAELAPGSYAHLDRQWAAGDVVELELPMRVRLLEGHPQIETVRNQVAVARGPVVYCLESHDLPEGVSVSDVVLPRDATLTPHFHEALLGGVTVLDGEVKAVRSSDWTDTLYRELATELEPIKLRLIPYFAWNNRGVPEMTVWLPLGR